MKLKNYPLAVAALLFFINGACVAQSPLAPLPDTPAANQAKGWLEVFNAGDVEKRRAFLQKNYPSRLERFDRETEMRRGTPMLRPWRWRAGDEWRVEDLPWARLCGCCVGEPRSAGGVSSCKLHYQSTANQVDLGC